MTHPRIVSTAALVLGLALGGTALGQSEPSSQPTSQPSSAPSQPSGQPSAAAQANAPVPELDAISVDAPADVAAPPWNADLTVSGLSSRVMRAGTGTVHPTAQDQVTVHYAGWTTDGELFDSSVSRGTPATFGLTSLIEGWQEGIPLMVEGEIRRFWIPADLAYGNPASGGRPSGMLVFDIELISIAP